MKKGWETSLLSVFDTKSNLVGMMHASCLHKNLFVFASCISQRIRFVCPLPGEV
jgi:hypothetical protein